MCSTGSFCDLNVRGHFSLLLASLFTLNSTLFHSWLRLPACCSGLDKQKRYDSRLTGSSFSTTCWLTTYSSCHPVLLDIALYVHLSFLILCSEHLIQPLPRSLPWSVVSFPGSQLLGWRPKTKPWLQTIMPHNVTPGGLASGEAVMSPLNGNKHKLNNRCPPAHT